MITKSSVLSVAITFALLAHVNASQAAEREDLGTNLRTQNAGSPALVKNDRSGSPSGINSAAERGVMYGLSGTRGALGIALDLNGWDVQRSNLQDVPKSKNSVLYINAHDYPKDQQLIDFIANFSGVLIVDSHDIKSVVESKTESGEVEVLEALSGTTAADVFSKLTAKVSGGIGGIVPEATTIIASMNNGKLTIVNSTAPGMINGVEASELREKVLDLDTLVEENENAPEGRNWDSDRVIDVPANYRDGWIAAFRIFANATRSGDGRWIVVTAVNTGNDASCAIFGKKCGIYPDSDSNILQTWADGNGYSMRAWANEYAAYAVGVRSIQAPEFKPRASDWGSNEYRENDAYEISYGSDYEFSLSSWINPWTYVESSVSYALGAVTRNRKTFRTWLGYDRGHTSTRQVQGPAGEIQSGFVTQSGIYLSDAAARHRRGLGINQTSDRVAFENGAKPVLLQGLTGCPAIPPKPVMTFDGWQPAIVAAHEFYPRRNSFTTKPGHVSVQAGVVWERQNLRYYWQPGAQWCRSTRSGLYLTSGGAGSDAQDLVTPDRGNSTTYNVGTVFHIAHNLFN